MIRLKFKNLLKQAVLQGATLFTFLCLCAVSLAEVQTQVTVSYQQVNSLSPSSRQTIYDSRINEGVDPQMTIPQHWELKPDNLTVNFKVSSNSKMLTGEFAQVDSDVHYDRLHPDNSHMRFIINTQSALVTDTNMNRSLPTDIFYNASIHNDRSQQVMLSITPEDFHHALSSSVSASAIATKGSLIVGDNSYPIIVIMSLGSVEISPITREPVIPFRVSSVVNPVNDDDNIANFWRNLTVDIIGELSYVKLY